MRKRLLRVMILGFAFVLTACGGTKNDTAMEAAETIMSGMAEGDTEKLDEINRSDEWNFPTDQLIVLANDYGIIDSKVKDMTFKEGEDNTVMVTFTDKDGEEETWTLSFVKQKSGYYFVGLE